MMKQYCFSGAENALRNGDISHINKPFPKQKDAQLIDKKGQVAGYMTRTDYNMLKRIQGMKEVQLPKEEGLQDWKGLVFQQTSRS